MENAEGTKEERLSSLKRHLADLQANLPQQCNARVTPEHWQEIEDLEDEIKALETELGDRE